MKAVALVAVSICSLVLPVSAFAGTRYASPTGSSGNDCLTPATACDLRTAVVGTGGNLPSSGDEVVVEPGPYSLTTTDITPGANNMDIHGASGQPHPAIASSVVWHMFNGTLSDVDLDFTNGQLVKSGGLLDRATIVGHGSFGQPVCQCYGGLESNSLIVANGNGSALGVSSNGGTATGTFRNDTAISNNATYPAIEVFQQSPPNNLIFDAYNAIARNLAGGTDVHASGQGASITFHHSNYATTDPVNAGVIQDAPSDPHQSAAPLFTNQGAGDFSEAAGSPTIDAGLTDSLNGTLDLAGNPRTVGSSTDIGAYEYVPPAPSSPSPSTGTPPGFRLAASKVRVTGAGKGSLGFTCLSPSGDRCTVAGTLTAGGAAAAKSLGRISGTVAGGSTGTLLVKLTKTGRKRLAAKPKLRVLLSGSVSNTAAQSAPLAASLTLKAKK